MAKVYDRAYFDRWYRGRAKIGAPVEVRRKVAAAVGMAEYLLHRQVRNAIDIGCGETPWYDHLHEIRPKIRYAGYDPSDYVVQRFGTTRNVRRGTFGELPSLGIRERFDLVVCSDVLHYVSEGEIRRGLPALVRLIRGLAYIEILTGQDSIFGDMVGIYRRPAIWYRDLFAAAKLVRVAPFMWTTQRVANDLAALER
ncbi:MAG TPA: class I SAM-dependent methyltransferase [Thermoanaerobaculia bacterium]|nr:class I SAM-dependent methyltransferase [Thermoanaerobaculia bacterium]